MTARAPTKAPKETWVDWMPEGAPEPGLLTRDELLEMLRTRGVDLSPSTLDFYRRSGVIPRPVRRWYAGQTRPVYPEWLVGAITHLRTLQEQGRALQDIEPYMRAWALSEIRWVDPLKPATTVVDRALKTYAQEVMEKTHTPSVNTIRVIFLDDDGNDVWNHETGLA